MTGTQNLEQYKIFDVLRDALLNFQLSWMLHPVVQPT
jgi:hypothetical protein